MVWNEWNNFRLCWDRTMLLDQTLTDSKPIALTGLQRGNKKSRVWLCCKAHRQHHSRNTYEKEWINTWILSCNNKNRPSFAQVHNRLHLKYGRDSVVGIATLYELDGPRFRTSGGEIFFARQDRLRSPLRLPARWVQGQSRGVKRPGRCLDHRNLLQALSLKDG
jgi:hypothetical protein